MIGLFLGDTDFSEIILKRIIKLKKRYLKYLKKTNFDKNFKQIKKI